MWRDYIQVLLPQLSVEGKLRLEELVIERARAVAAAAGGVVGVRAVSRSEQSVLVAVAAAFGRQLN